MHISQPQRSYRATYIPKDIELDEVEFQAGQGLLPSVQLKAASAEAAAADAYRVTGRPIHSVTRVGA